uniref:Zn(2)-C6 fungal-type domain-containing protein n=1 Tax=Fusarium oxysporum (strain Fo5176) TaxID=660025 RepID=A0A0D2Y6K0_FUSOF
MLSGMSQQTDATPVIRRSRIACKACHQRRVKCDAADGIPCMHCRTRNTTCELIESRRGRYIRQKPSKPHRRPMRNRSGPVANPSDDSVSLPDTTIHVSTLEENSATQVPLVTVTDSVPAQDAPDKRSCPSDNSLTLSSIIQMVRRAKESGSGNFHINEQESIPLVDKTLYDAGHEKDATHLTAALHLLSFWWLGPSDQKDSWYWHGCAVTLAQSLGMHRSPTWHESTSDIYLETGMVVNIPYFLEITRLSVIRVTNKGPETLLFSCFDLKPRNVRHSRRKNDNYRLERRPTPSHAPLKTFSLPR